ncbi:MAG TPA: hypothetical protein ENJ18_15115 [Nannocystis exedens]|nr:hypothetical protein [Nannocystis exedens]
MKSSYRVILFAPNPLTASRFALGAVVNDGEQIQVAKVSHIPGPDCLGRARSAILARRIHDSLAKVSSMETLPSSFGPSVTFGETREIPCSVRGNALEWVQKYVLNHPRDESSGVTRRPRLSAYAQRFYETWHLSQYVKKRYLPRDDETHWGGATAYLKSPIRHWTSSEKELLLMEPIAPTRPQCKADIRELAEKLAAYRHAITTASPTRETTLCVLVLAGGDSSLRRETHSLLGDVAHQVVDTDEAGARKTFIETVRRIGSESLALN